MGKGRFWRVALVRQIALEKVAVKLHAGNSDIRRAPRTRSSIGCSFSQLVQFLHQQTTSSSLRHQYDSLCRLMHCVCNW